MVVPDPELLSQQNQKTAQIVPDPFPHLGVGSGYETRLAGAHCENFSRLIMFIADDTTNSCTYACTRASTYVHIAEPVKHMPSFGLYHFDYVFREAKLFLAAVVRNVTMHTQRL